MKWMQEQRKYENLTYLALWGMLFAVPVLSLYIRTVNDPYYTFNWELYLAALGTAVPYTVTYAVSNFFFLWLMAKPFGEKLGRIKIKYGV